MGKGRTKYKQGPPEPLSEAKLAQLKKRKAGEDIDAAAGKKRKAESKDITKKKATAQKPDVKIAKKKGTSAEKSAPVNGKSIKAKPKDASKKKAIEKAKKQLFDESEES